MWDIPRTNTLHSIINRWSYIESRRGHPNSPKRSHTDPPSILVPRTNNPRFNSSDHVHFSRSVCWVECGAFHWGGFEPKRFVSGSAEASKVSVELLPCCIPDKFLSVSTGHCSPGNNVYWTDALAMLNSGHVSPLSLCSLETFVSSNY